MKRIVYGDCQEQNTLDSPGLAVNVRVQYRSRTLSFDWSIFDHPCEPRRKAQLHFAVNLIASLQLKRCTKTMASDDFAAAQKRILARQHARATESQARVEERKQRAIALRARFPVPGIERGLQAWDRLNNSEGTRPAFRAGQLDAELLDEELLELLKGQVGEGLRFFGVYLSHSLHVNQPNDGSRT